MRTQMKNKKGTDIFVASARIASFNRLFGLSTASAYRQPNLPGLPEKTKNVDAKQLPKITNTSGFAG